MDQLKPNPELQFTVDIGQLTLSDIAKKISIFWTNPYFGAKPYLSAMRQLNHINDNYGLDNGKSIVLYFLANAGSWRGPIAREIKAELKKRAGIK